jgi:hypothetical protein
VYYLYQFAWGKYPHFVVANDYAHAEELINNAGYSTPNKIARVSMHVITPGEHVAHQPPPVLPEEELPEIAPLNEMTEDSSYMEEKM